MFSEFVNMSAKFGSVLAPKHVTMSKVTYALNYLQGIWTLACAYDQVPSLYRVAGTRWDYTDVGRHD